MSNSHRSTPINGNTIVFILVLASFVMIAVGLPVRRDVLRNSQANRELKDPMMALPSGLGEQYTSADNIPAPIVDSQVGPVYRVAQEVQYQPDGLPQYQLYETVLQQQRASYLKNDQAQVARTGANYDHKQEYSPLAGPGQSEFAYANAHNKEYPGEIIYVDVNGETRSVEQSGATDQSGGGFPNIADMVYRNSMMPATILTEVPVRDMPQEVLEKLKKDYGVKVVATRERPGANLIINCDEYASQENTICVKHQISPVTINNQQSYSAPTRTADPQAIEDYQGGPREQERPHIPNEPSYHGENLAEPRPETYAAKDGQVRDPREQSSSENEQRDHEGANFSSQRENHNLDYSIRRESHDPTAQAEPLVQPEGAYAQSENESNGRDESVDRSDNTKNSHQYDNRRD